MNLAEVIVMGGGIAGLSAAIYLGRAKRDTLVIDNGKSMARWEPDVQNYLGFPKGISGAELLQRARNQVRRYEVRVVRDEIVSVRLRHRKFFLRGKNAAYSCHRLLLATGIFHVPPDIPGVKPCLGTVCSFAKTATDIVCKVSRLQFTAGPMRRLNMLWRCWRTHVV